MCVKSICRRDYYGAYFQFVDLELEVWKYMST